MLLDAKSPSLAHQVAHVLSLPSNAKYFNVSDMHHILKAGAAFE